MKKTCVIGSFNIDIIVTLDDFPGVGETVFTRTWDLFVGGGKGGNQAVALGKLGADTRMVGKLGDRFYGSEYMEVLKKHHIKCDTVSIEKNSYPGAAFVAVDGNKDNILFVYSGANLLVSPDFIKKNWDEISACDIFLLQLEIPYETNLFVAKELRKLGKTIILDPAPVRRYTDEILQYVDYVTPNEVELGQLSGMAVSDEESIRRASLTLLDKGVKTVIPKVGKRGSYLVERERFVSIPVYDVKSVDPTAAGDCYNAGMACAMAEGKDILDCLKFATAVASLSTTAIGAQNAMPTLSDTRKLMESTELIIKVII